jgi:hypothetical protein
MRTSLIIVVAMALALLLGAPPPQSTASTCGETSCGVPSCWNASVRTRPDVTRTVTISCSGAENAKLVSPPAHGQVSNVALGFYTLQFDVHADAGSPRFDEATFELTGRDASIEQRVQIEVIPTSENSPPVCDGDTVTQRSDGSGPVSVFLHPYCRDPDGDDFVIEGGPPGVHYYSPKHVPAGQSDMNWPYLTATHSGHETTTIWATDSLGARSADAQLDITVGPGVDRGDDVRALVLERPELVHTDLLAPGRDTAVRDYLHGPRRGPVHRHTVEPSGARGDRGLRSRGPAVRLLGRRALDRYDLRADRRQHRAGPVLSHSVWA